MYLNYIQIKEKISELKESLPFGSIKEISKRGKIRQNTIIELFKGRTKNPRKSTVEKIFKIGKEILEENDNYIKSINK